VFAKRKQSAGHQRQQADSIINPRTRPAGPARSPAAGSTNDGQRPTTSRIPGILVTPARAAGARGSHALRLSLIGNPCDNGEAFGAASVVSPDSPSILSRSSRKSDEGRLPLPSPPPGWGGGLGNPGAARTTRAIQDSSSPTKIIGEFPRDLSPTLPPPLPPAGSRGLPRGRATIGELNLCLDRVDL
jgi:hypothetical protein